MNNFSDYWRSLSPQEKKRLAKAATTSINYLSQVCGGHRNPGLNLARRLVAADPNISMVMFFDHTPQAS